MARYVDIENNKELIDAIVMLLKDCELQHKKGCLAPNCNECIRRFFDYEHLLPTVNTQEVKHSGIIRRVDDFGRIAIPKEIRKQFEVHDGDPLEIIADNNGIRLVKYIPEDERNDE